MTDREHPPVASHRLPALAKKFHDKQYRDGYVASHTRRVLAEQMRNFRGDQSQADYAMKIDKQKTVVGRLENPAYGGWSLRTMLEIARKEDVAVVIRFVDFPTFLGFTDDMSDEALSPKSYDAIGLDDFAASASHSGTSKPAAVEQAAAAASQAASIQSVHLTNIAQIVNATPGQSSAPTLPSPAPADHRDVITPQTADRMTTFGKRDAA